MEQKDYEELNKIEQVGSTNDKETMIIEFLKNTPEAEKFFRFTFNGFVYGLSDKSIYNACSDIPGVENDFASASDFLNIWNGAAKNSEFRPMQDLIEFGETMMKLSGQNQLEAIKDFFQLIPCLQAKWWCRALLHDLRMGANMKTINSCFAILDLKQVQKFELQLCGKLDLYENQKHYKNLTKITYPCVMEIKEDGIRIQANIYTENEETRCVLTSRRGKDRTMLHIALNIELCEIFKGKTLILDGEIKSSSFQELTRKYSKIHHKYIVFDLLEDEGLDYAARWDNLFNIFNGIESSYVRLVEHYTASNLEELREYFGACNEKGEEGIIVKLLDKPYERGTRKNMFKVKQVLTAEMRIIGCEMGEGKRTGKIATLQLVDASMKVFTDVGSGLDDVTCEALTQQYNENPDNPPFIDRICTIKYNELTEIADGKRRVRFPRFICLRDDKDEADNMWED